MGQSSLPVLNRLGSHMYWNNSWVNVFNNKIFFNKTLFFENIFYFLFSEKIFTIFFFNFKNNFVKSQLFKQLFFKKQNKIKNSIFLKKTKNKKQKNAKYNFTRVWFIKYNNYILLSSFVFFYLKVKKKTKAIKIQKYSPKAPKLFWNKKKGQNLKVLFYSKYTNMYF